MRFNTHSSQIAPYILILDSFDAFERLFHVSDAQKKGKFYDRIPGGLVAFLQPNKIRHYIAYHFDTRSRLATSVSAARGFTVGAALVVTAGLR